MLYYCIVLLTTGYLRGVHGERVVGETTSSHFCRVCPRVFDMSIWARLLEDTITYRSIIVSRHYHERMTLCTY